MGNFLLEVGIHFAVKAVSAEAFFGRAYGYNIAGIKGSNFEKCWGIDSFAVH